jgi:phosphate starvation-inducible protein PhoH
MTVTRHANRKPKSKASPHQDRHESRTQRGTEMIMSERAVNNEEYKLDWFKPTEKQKEIVYSMVENGLTIVSASSGCGKSTTAIWQGLRDLKAGKYKRILFIKSPTDSSDDAIGYLTGDAASKLEIHLRASRGIFSQFMSEAKLEMEEKRGRINFAIPNFIQGATFDDTLIIIDESQQLSPPILKLVMERVGEGSSVVVLGDKRQRYAYRKREDGFSFFVNLVTDIDDEGRYSKIENIGYVEMSAADNMRSELSKLVVALFEEAM